MNGHGYYALDPDGIARPVTVSEFRAVTSPVIRVARTEMTGMLVSTVFLGIDHSFGEGGPPVLFETMVFHRDNSGYMQRYCTRDEALAGHENLCTLMRQDLKERRKGYSESHWRLIWRRRWL